MTTCHHLRVQKGSRENNKKAQLMPTNPRDAMLCRRAKFGDDRTMRGRVIAYFRFSEWPRPPSWIWYDVIADHPRLVFDGPNIILKLHVDHFNILRDIAIFIFGPFGLKLPIHAHFW